MPHDKQAQRWCPQCKALCLATKPRAKHGLHAVGTLLTGGLWSVGWAGAQASASSVPWRCPRCGSLTEPPEAQFRRVIDVRRLLIVGAAVILFIVIVQVFRK